MAESHIGAVDVVVDRFRHSHHGHVLLGEPVRGRQRALATDWDEDVDAVVVEGLLDLIQPGPQLFGIHPGRPEHRSALGEQPVVAVVISQLNATVLQQPAPAVLETDHRGAVPGVAGTYYRANYSVEAGTVTAAREYSDAHAFILPCGLVDGAAMREISAARR